MHPSDPVGSGAMWQLAGPILGMWEQIGLCPLGPNPFSGWEANRFGVKTGRSPNKDFGRFFLLVSLDTNRKCLKTHRTPSVALGPAGALGEAAAAAGAAAGG